jgi:hypothetical protein
MSATGQSRTKQVCAEDVGSSPTSGPSLSQNALVGGNQSATLGKPRLVQQEITKTFSRLWPPWNHRRLFVAASQSSPVNLTERYMPWLSGAFGLIGALIGARTVGELIPMAALR